MSKPVGFYLLEKCLRKYRSWPTSQWIRGIGVIILVGVNTVWATYPIMINFINYKTNFEKCIFHMQFIMVGLLVVSGSIQGLWNQNRVNEMINLLTDFNQFGTPPALKFLESNMKTILKMIHYGGFLISYLMTYFKMFEDSCANFKNIKHCLIFEYYVPFDLKPWEMTLILLFQIYSVGIVLNISYFAISSYWYSLELLVVRIENLKDILENINLTRNERRNFKILRSVIMYHQDIFRMFQFVKNFYTNLLPQKMTALIGLTISTTEFVLRKDLLSFFMIILTGTGIFLSHAIGQRLITAANTVAEAVYNLNWYDADASARTDILIFLSMSQKALVIEVPLFGQMSNAAAAHEFKKAYLFFNSLLTITKKINF